MPVVARFWSVKLSSIAYDGKDVTKNNKRIKVWLDHSQVEQPIAEILTLTNLYI